MADALYKVHMYGCVFKLSILLKESILVGREAEKVYVYVYRCDQVENMSSYSYQCSQERPMNELQIFFTSDNQSLLC